MNDFLHRLTVGFCRATAVTDLYPCRSFKNSEPLDAKYAGVPRTENFPNPWHIGGFDADKYPVPNELCQGELELLAFMFSFVVQVKPMLIVETGTNIGLMTRALGCACWANGFGKVVSSDVDAAMVQYAKALLVGLPVEVRHCPSLDLPELRDADLVFIDSSYESRSEEHKLIKSGGIYVYHDSFAEPWIKSELEHEKNVVHLDSPRGISIVRKP